nr:site-specific integrase [Nocardioides flavescens]
MHAAVTKRAKRTGLRHFDDWLTAHRGRAIQSATTRDIANYLAEWDEAGKSVASQRNRFHVLRGYFRWLELEGEIARSPMTGMQPRQEVRKLPQSVSVDELRLMLDNTVSDQGWLIIAVLAVNSLRVSELLGCDVSNVERRNGFTHLRFDSNLGQQRPPLIVLAPEVEVVLSRYLKGRRSGPLILNVNGGRLNRSSAASMVRLTAQRAGIPYTVTPQMLSYTLQATALENGFSLTSVLRAMGVPQPRHSMRWMTADRPLSQDNASLRLARMVFHPTESTQNALSNVESLLSDASTPDAFALMAAGAVLERHLRLLCMESGVQAPEPQDLGSINRWAGELQRLRVLETADRHLVDSIGNRRNWAAHGFFERLEVGMAEQTYRSVLDIVTRYPLRDAAATVR